MNRIFAAIVTYHPGTDLEANIAAVRKQVQSLLLVDNRSTESERAMIRQLASAYDCELVENPENAGIAVALNQAVQKARQDPSCDFILFLDQDSVVAENFVSEMIACYDQSSQRDRVFLVAPRIVDRITSFEDTPRGGPPRYLVAQTSGSLMPLKAFTNDDRFRDDLFIDFVDYEFCLRSVSRGGVILYCESAVLHHCAGNPERRRLFGAVSVTTSNYSPVREYYLKRNGLWVLRRYGLRFPLWSAELFYETLKSVAKVLLLESDRERKARMWIRALRDAFHSRLGRCPYAG